MFIDRTSKPFIPAKIKVYKYTQTILLIIPAKPPVKSPPPPPRKLNIHNLKLRQYFVFFMIS